MTLSTHDTLPYQVRTIEDTSASTPYVTLCYPVNTPYTSLLMHPPTNT